jgi:5-methyltetrahydropteroyltriglutamate--homocysteine methyltransferase
MLRSDGRILTTHTGSLPRPPALTQMLLALSKREEVDRESLHEQVQAATLDVIRKQKSVGIDVGNNGEQGRESFFTYVQHRLSGYGGESDRPLMRDLTAFPTFVTLKWPEYSQRQSVTLIRAPKAIAEVRHISMDLIEKECNEFARLLADEGKPFAEMFMTAASPGIIAAGMLNDFYLTEDEYVLAVADAMRHEYQQIVSSGFVLQLDCPDLAMERHSSYADRSLDDFKAYVGRNIAAINRAIEGCRPTASACTLAGAATRARTTLTCLSRRYCRCCTRRTLVRSYCRSPTRGTSTNGGRWRSTRRRTTC